MYNIPSSRNVFSLLVVASKSSIFFMTNRLIRDALAVSFDETRGTKPSKLFEDHLSRPSLR